MEITTPNSNSPLPNPLREARRLTALAHAEHVTARLLGGVAVAIRAEGRLPPALQRPYKDLDYVTRRRDAATWAQILERAGYVPDAAFNRLHGAQRLLHYDPANAKQLDTFIDTFAMCHVLDLQDRLPTTGETLSPADLLLTKLQIVEVNDKDLIDTIALLLSHPLGRHSEDVIDLTALAGVLGQDWGWYTTISDNLTKVKERLSTVNLDPEPKETVLARLEELQEALPRFPKTLKWKLRAKVGRRLIWYDLPEEVDEH
ncbi:MAG: hypothetical protein M0Z54_00070 [Thermaerobacter sp.]|nr:hypothetical protein [Thermaerobacter sp.]